MWAPTPFGRRSSGYLGAICKLSTVQIAIILRCGAQCKFNHARRMLKCFRGDSCRRSAQVVGSGGGTTWHADGNCLWQAGCGVLRENIRRIGCANRNNSALCGVIQIFPARRLHPCRLRVGYGRVVGGPMVWAQAVRRCAAARPSRRRGTRPGRACGDQMQISTL